MSSLCALRQVVNHPLLGLQIVGGLLFIAFGIHACFESIE